jgi:hypothetical protein
LLQALEGLRVFPAGSQYLKGEGEGLVGGMERNKGGRMDERRRGGREADGIRGRDEGGKHWRASGYFLLARST